MYIFFWQLKNTLRREVFWARLFAPIGFFWTVFQIAEKFQYEWITNILLRYWGLIPIACIVYALYYSWQKKTITIKLKKYDTEFCVKVGNIMKSDAPILFGVPTTLDNSFEDDLISKNSIQGQYSETYANSPNEMQDVMLEASGNLTNFQKLSKDIKPYGPRKKFQEGEIIVLRCFRRIAYLVSFATFNEYRTAQLNTEDFYQLLPRMWEGVRERGNVGNLDMPLLGTVHARTGLNQKETFLQIILSFNAACSEKRLVDKLTIYIWPKDFKKGDFSFEYLERTVGQVFLDHPETMNGLGNERLGTGLS